MWCGYAFPLSEEKASSKGFFQRTVFILFVSEDVQRGMKMSLLEQPNPTLPQLLRYTDLSFTGSTTIGRDIACLFENVLQS